MTVAALARPALPSLVARVLFGQGISSDGADRFEPTHEADRCRRDFVSEMTCRNPEAFASEYDVCAMMQMYPERF